MPFVAVFQTTADNLKEHGEPHACEYHLRALAGLLPSDKSKPHTRIESTDTSSIDILGLYLPDPTDSMPAGFRFYISLNLLPACLVQSIASIGTNRTHSRNPRNAWRALACRPSDDQGRGQQRHGLIYRVCCHIQIAAALLAIGFSDSQSQAGPGEDCVDAWHAESLTLDTSSLFGSVYDEVLIWSLCIFCGMTRLVVAEQVDLLRSSLESSEVRDWDALDSLLERYIAPRRLRSRLQHILGRL